MTDDEFLTAFENCTLPIEQWTHDAHVQVAFLYASRLDLKSATDRMRASVKAYNKATRTPEAIDRGYHETITQAFMRLVFTAIQKTGPHGTSHEFCRTHPELLNKYVLGNHYSRERLMTWEAKAQFVEPDRIALPATESAPDAVPPAERFEFVEELNHKQIEQLHRLIQQQWWGGRRSLEDVKLMVENTSLMIGLVALSTGRLVGFCRMLTDFAFRATVYDVMVAEEFQGHGLGKRLMDTLLSHPKLQRVSYIYLACEPHLCAFYERWGFTTYEGRAEWMIKVQREE